MNDGKVMFRINNDLKHEFETIVNGLGMTQTTAFTVFMLAVVRCGGIPFDMRLSSKDKADESEQAQPVMDATA